MEVKNFEKRLVIDVKQGEVFKITVINISNILDDSFTSLFQGILSLQQSRFIQVEGVGIIEVAGS